jgi:hypothetical protein
MPIPQNSEYSQNLTQAGLAELFYGFFKADTSLTQVCHIAALVSNRIVVQQHISLSVFR